MMWKHGSRLRGNQAVQLHTIQYSMILTDVEIKNYPPANNPGHLEKWCIDCIIHILDIVLSLALCSKMF